MTVQTGISDLDLVFASHSFPLWMNEAALRYWNSMDSHSCGQGAEDDASGFAKKTFPDFPCVSQMLGGPSLRLGDTKACLKTVLQVSHEVGMHTDRLVTCEFPLRTDSCILKILRIFSYN